MEDDFIKYDRAIKALELVDGVHWKSLVYGVTDVNRNKDDLMVLRQRLRRKLGVLKGRKNDKMILSDLTFSLLSGLSR